MMKNMVIVIFSIIILCLCGYLIYDKVIDKKDSNIKDDNKVEDNVNKDKEENKDNDYNLEKAKNLVDKYIILGTDDTFNGLDNGLKLNIARKNLNYNGLPEKISYEEMNKIYKELFGDEEASKYGFSPGFCDWYNFDLEQNSYILKKCEQGVGGNTGTIDYSVKSAVINNSKLDIVVYYYSIDPMGSLNRYYKFSMDSDRDKIADLSSNEITTDYKLTYDAFEKYKDQMDTFTFRFEKYNENYVLRSVFKN